jgi:hypothetical protein
MANIYCEETQAKSNYWMDLANFMLQFKDNPKQVIHDLKWLSAPDFKQLQLAILEELPK